MSKAPLALLLGAIGMAFALNTAAGQARCMADAHLPHPLPARRPADELLLPVVVHVVWHSPEENISDAQIHSQIEVLNEDFSGQAAADFDVPSFFQPLVHDSQIQFCLVGITRTYTSVEGIASVFQNGKRRVCYAELGGQDAIMPEQVLNIWVSGRGDGTLGSATFPWEAADKPLEDGVFIPPHYFGRLGTVAPPYHLGRTCTHEVGHYLGLRHLWGPGANNFDCNEDDGIADTPLQADTYQGLCPPFPLSSCGTADLYLNFMNFTDDACLALFTPGQTSQMHASAAAFRPGLLGADCSPVSTREENWTAGVRVYPNPSTAGCTISFPDDQPWAITIFAPDGRLLHRQRGRGTARLGTETVPASAGICYIKISYRNKMLFKKLIIAR